MFDYWKIWGKIQEKENSEEEKKERRKEGKKKWRKIENKFKINKLFLYVSLNSFHFFFK